MIYTELSGKLSERTVETGYGLVKGLKNFAFAGHPTKPGVLPPIKLVGDFHIDCDSNFCHARITLDTPKGYTLKFTKGNNRRIYIRDTELDVYSVMDAAALPPNVDNSTGRYWDKDHIFRTWKRTTQMQAIWDDLKNLGPSGRPAFKVFWQAIRAGSPTMTTGELKTAFDVNIGNNPIDSDKFLARLRGVLGGYTWAQVRNYIQNASEDQLNFRETEVDEEWD